MTEAFRSRGRTGRVRSLRRTWDPAVRAGAGRDSLQRGVFGARVCWFPERQGLLELVAGTRSTCSARRGPRRRQPPSPSFQGSPRRSSPPPAPAPCFNAVTSSVAAPRTISATRLDTRIAPRQGREARPVAHRMASFHRATPGPHPPTRRMGEAEGTRVPRSVSEFSPVLRSSIADESVRTCLARHLRPATAWGSCSPETGMLIFPRKRGTFPEASGKIRGRSGSLRSQRRMASALTR